MDQQILNTAVVAPINANTKHKQILFDSIIQAVSHGVSNPNSKTCTKLSKQKEVSTFRGCSGNQETLWTSTLCHPFNIFQWYLML